MTAAGCATEQFDGRGMGAGGAAHSAAGAAATDVMSMSARSSTVMYVRHGRQWRAVPKDLPPRSTLYDYSIAGVGTVRSIASRRALREVCEAAAREASPTAATSTARASRARKKGAAMTAGYDAGKKIKGKKRHVVIRKAAMHAIVHPRRPRPRRRRARWRAVAPRPASSRRRRLPRAGTRAREAHRARHPRS